MRKKDCGPRTHHGVRPSGKQSCQWGRHPGQRTIPMGPMEDGEAFPIPFLIYARRAPSYSSRDVGRKPPVLVSSDIIGIQGLPLRVGLFSLPYPQRDAFRSVRARAHEPKRAWACGYCRAVRFFAIPRSRALFSMADARRRRGRNGKERF